jgi:hypothetical protein
MKQQTSHITNWSAERRNDTFGYCFIAGNPVQSKPVIVSVES